MLGWYGLYGAQEGMVIHPNKSTLVKSTTNSCGAKILAVLYSTVLAAPVRKDSSSLQKSCNNHENVEVGFFYL